MAKAPFNPHEWPAFEYWALSELDTSAFRLKLMTDAEKEEIFGSPPATKPLLLVVNSEGQLVPRDTSPASEPELDEETEKRLLDEIEARDEQEKAETLAFAERLGCSIYLAGYLRYLNTKLDIVADALIRSKVAVPEPKRRKKSKR